MAARAYEFLPDEELTEDSLLQDNEFLEDASTFIYERTGEEVYEPEEIMDKFLHQMRSGQVNEISMYRDLEYAQNADDTGKQRFGRLIDTFDRMDTNFDLGTVGDYAYGIATAPSTIIGAGVGKIGSQVAIQAGRQGLKQMLMRGLTKPGIAAGAARAAAVEAPLAAIGEDVFQRTREETGLGRQEGAVAGAAVGGAVFGGLLGGVAGYFGKQGAEKASELSRTAQRSIQQRKIAQRAVNAKEKEKLMQLNPELVAEGDRILKELNENTSFSAALPDETIESVVTAVTRMGAQIKRKKGQRITEAVADAIINDEITGETFENILKEHKLTKNQFTAVYVADISEAARKLGRQSQLKRKLESLAAKGAVEMDDREILEAARKPNKFFEFLRSMDRLRLGAMTSQLATTVRNTIGGGFRLGVDAMDQGFMQAADVIKGKTSARDAFKNITSTGRYFFNQKEAAVIQEIFSDQMPKEAQRLFFSAASAESRVGSDSVLGKIGNTINIANTFSDSLFKRAVFASTLDRQLRTTQGRSLNDVIKAGEFNTLDKDMIKDAIEESLYFAYQQSPKIDTPLGEAGDLLIKMHRSVPFVVSAVIPFPRFIMNQMKFVYEHMPGVPALFGGINGSGVSKEAMAKQFSGGLMITAATMFRAQQDPDTRWDEIKDSRGNVINMAAVYGPFAPFMIMGDLIARGVRGEPIDSIEKYIGETAQALGSPRFTGQFGLLPIDRLFDDIADGKWARAAGKVVGDVLGTYTIPLATIKDINSAYSRDARFIEDMDTILPSTGEPMLDWFAYSVHYAQKYLPRWDEEDGLTYDVAPEDRRYSVTTGRLERVSPLEKQLFGTTRYTPKNALQSELDRLQIQRNRVYGTDPDPIRNALNQYVLGSYVPKRMNAFIISEEYQNMDDATRADQLVARARTFIEGDVLKGYVDEMMEELVGDDKHFMYRQAFREKYEEFPKERRRLLEQMWKESDMYNGMSISESGAFHWAVETNEGLGRIIE